MDFLREYKFWMENEHFDLETRNELKAIQENPTEIEDRFYKELEFGTAGLRGVIGAGTNRMNIYIVRKASQGLAAYINKLGEEAMKRGIVIAYDSRYKSPEFALEAARVFCAHGIMTYLFDELRPVPELSFSVRHLNAAAGIVITASHNPKEYNGYKVYGEDGAQLSLEASNVVLEEIGAITDITKVKLISKEEALERGLLKIIGKEIDDVYIAHLKTLSINPDAVKAVGDTFKIVYTPLHGTGNKPVRRILAETGFKNILVVKEQELPDSNFSTVKSPNPEDKAAFKLAIELAKKEDVDLIFGTDPDCDRVGVVVRNAQGDYVTLTGNQTGCLLTEYILSQKQKKGTLPKKGFIVKTIVTTELARTIAKHYGVELIEVLTGFKFIGEKIRELDEFGDMTYLFGFEESYGYLAGTFARDKDGVVTSMLIAEMAAYYKARGLSLYEGLQELYLKYGCFVEGVNAFTLKGKEGLEKISESMSWLRSGGMEAFPEIQLSAFRDYQEKTRITVDGNREMLDLPQSDVLYYELGDGSWFCVRPSGTEPKIKVYYGVSDHNRESADLKLDSLQNEVLKVVQAQLQ